MLKGFSFTQNGKEICEFIPLSSDLIRKSKSDHDIFSIGMAYSNMDLINISLIAAYDVGGMDEYERILQIYTPYVKEIAKIELEFMGILPQSENISNNEILLSNYEELTNFLLNPDWKLISLSIKNSIKKIATKITDEVSLKEGLLLRDFHKISSIQIIPGIQWYERPIATLPLAAKFLESHSFPDNLTMTDFHDIVFDGITKKIEEFIKTEKRSPIFSDLAHDSVISVLRCVKLAKNNPILFYFSAIRYSCIAQLMRDLTLSNQTISCPFFLFCNDFTLRNQIRQTNIESCLIRDTLMNSLKMIENTVPDSECCPNKSDFPNSEAVSHFIPEHIEKLLNVLIHIISSENDCILCNSLKNTLIEQGYTKEMISDLAKNTKEHLKNHLNNVIFPQSNYLKSSSEIPIEIDDHFKLFGKEPWEVNYGEKCPLCHTRIDEYGFCSCGSSGD